MNAPLDLAVLNDDLFLCYTGMETDLVFNRGIDLPGFASFPLLESSRGREMLAGYYRQLLHIGQRYGIGIFLDTPTWVANPDRAKPLGYTADRLDRLNAEAVDFVSRLRDDCPGIPTVLSAQVGPRGDGYVVGDRTDPEESFVYHGRQIGALAAAGAELISAFTLTDPGEAVGIVRAAAHHGLPCLIAFTVETDGSLPSGDSLPEAIERVDSETNGGPCCYLVNCAHPEHFRDRLTGEQWIRRLRGAVVNASRCSHAELDEAEQLDDGDPEELGLLVGDLAERFPHFRVFGGCCGTDARHMEHIARQVAARSAR